VLIARGHVKVPGDDEDLEIDEVSVGTWAAFGFVDSSYARTPEAQELLRARRGEPRAHRGPTAGCLPHILTVEARPGSPSAPRTRVLIAFWST
jgi:hypothetical protein